MKRKLLSLLFIIIGIGGAVAQSADTNVDTTLDERVSQLEKRAEVWDKLKPALQFSGYIQSGYDY